MFLLLALDWDRFDKDSAIAADIAAGLRAAGRSRLDTAPSVGLDEEVENRVSATLSYTFGERVVAVSRVPFSQRHLTSTSYASGHVCARLGLEPKSLRFEIMVETPQSIFGEDGRVVQTSGWALTAV